MKLALLSLLSVLLVPSLPISTTDHNQVEVNCATVGGVLGGGGTENIGGDGDGVHGTTTSSRASGFMSC